LKANIRAQIPFSRPAANAGGFGLDLAVPPKKSFFVRRIHDPSNFGSMPELEFLNGILNFRTRARRVGGGNSN
jgi:hypothetical protein